MTVTEPESRRWYTKPDMIVALSAVLISLCTVGVTGYEAWLQRHHDRAEVWPHVELSLVNTPEQSTLSLENTGIGPAIIKSFIVTVDGKPAHNWREALAAVLGRAPDVIENSTVVSRALRAGDRIAVVAVRRSDLPPGSMAKFARLAIRVCYASVFDDYWTLSDLHLGGDSEWIETKSCPVVAGSEF
jgi:hypothetical protein